MKGISTVRFISLGFVGLLAFGFVTSPLVAHADFSRKVIQKSFEQKKNPEFKLEGIREVKDPSELNLNSRTLTEEEVNRVQTAVTNVYAKGEFAQEALPNIFERSRSTLLSHGNTVVYIGAGVGYLLGFNVAVGAIIAHHSVTDELCYMPTAIIGMDAFDLGVSANVGLGTIDGDSKALTGGFQVGGAFIIGASYRAGIGKSYSDRAKDNKESHVEVEYAELKIGLRLQLGGFVEFVI